MRSTFWKQSTKTTANSYHSSKYLADEIYFIDNYRPISLLPAFSKIFERALYNQLFNYFSNNNLLYCSQYGFRTQHSTETAAIELTDRIIDMMNNNEIPISIFMDLSKAFDTINHKILISKLIHYGLDANSIALLSSYSQNRTQYVA